MTDDDIVLWLLRAINAEAPEVPTNAILRVERAARIFWGGARPYVPKGGSFVRDDKLPLRTEQRWMPGHGRGRPRKFQRG